MASGAGPDQRPAPRSDPVGRGALDAGPFAPWLSEVEVALRGEQPSAVPCGPCTACCTSSQFVHIGPDETDALAHIPRDLTFPAPGLPRGHVLLGYDERGHCPMLVDGACTIYAHRPRTCRTYDCRVFPATGIAPDPDKVRIVEQSRRWRFESATDADRSRLAAVRAAAAFLAERADALGPLPANPTQLAVLAIEIHGLFLAAPATDPDETTPAAAAHEPDLDAVRFAIDEVRTRR